MKARSAVYLLVAGATLLVAYSVVRDNRQWKATKRNNDQENLAIAAGSGDLLAVRAYVEGGADVNATPTRGGEKVHGYVPLTMAVTWTHEDVVRYLLDHGANPNGADGRPPLVHLCWYRFPRDPSAVLPIAKLLLEHGADPNARTAGSPETALAGAKAGKAEDDRLATSKRARVLVGKTEADRLVISRYKRESVNLVDLITLLQQYGAHD